MDSSDIALSGAIKQAGLTNVKQMYFTGYDSQILDNPSASSAFAGSYVGVSYDPASTNTPVQGMFNTLKQYDTSFKAGGIPDLGLYGSYISADLMLYGSAEGGAESDPGLVYLHPAPGRQHNAGGGSSDPDPFYQLRYSCMLPGPVLRPGPAYIAGGGQSRVLPKWQVRLRHPL